MGVKLRFCMDIIKLKIVITASEGAQTEKKMMQYKNSDNVMESGDHFKNGAKPAKPSEQGKFYKGE